MTNNSREQIEQTLKSIIDPHNELDLVSGNSVKDIKIDGDKVKIELSLGYPAKSWHQELINLVTGKIENSEVTISSDTVAHKVQEGVKPLKGVKNIVAIASGKGGVGKSTLTANFALALSAEGANVGVLDADIYGPSQPRMLGITGRPSSKDGKTLQPLESYNLQVMSIGFLVDEESPMIWRGPMVTQALEQMLHNTEWNDLDYLVIDLPPGTGDTQLTLAQKVPVSGSLIVTTPQDIALLDARKAYKMFEKVDIPVLGVVENMSTHICTNCGHEEHIFGQDGGRKMAQQYKLNFLGDIPLDLSIRENSDGGQPSVIAAPDSAITEKYKSIARKAAAKLALRKKDYSDKFPNITIHQG